MYDAGPESHVERCKRQIGELAELMASYTPGAEHAAKVIGERMAAEWESLIQRAEQDTAAANADNAEIAF